MWKVPANQHSVLSQYPSIVAVICICENLLQQFAQHIRLEGCSFDSMLAENPSIPGLHAVEVY